MASKKDYVPDSASNLKEWADLVATNLATVAADVEGWDTARVTALVARFTAIKTAAAAVIEAQNNFQQASGNLDAVLATEGSPSAARNSVPTR